MLPVAGKLVGMVVAVVPYCAHQDPQAQHRHGGAVGGLDGEGQVPLLRLAGLQLAGACGVVGPEDLRHTLHLGQRGHALLYTDLLIIDNVNF